MITQAYRRNDGEIFTKNLDGTFSNEALKRQFPEHYHHRWAEAVLISHGFEPVKPQLVAQVFIGNGSCVEVLAQSETGYRLAKQVLRDWCWPIIWRGRADEYF